MGVPDLSNATFSIDDLGKLNCLLFSFFFRRGNIVHSGGL
jgi:hypothetical protein